jgi:hypothetical protein
MRRLPTFHGRSIHHIRLEQDAVVKWILPRIAVEEVQGRDIECTHSFRTKRSHEYLGNLQNDETGFYISRGFRR